jgi:hypothetical protein
VCEKFAAGLEAQLSAMEFPSIETFIEYLSAKDSIHGLASFSLIVLAFLSKLFTSFPRSSGTAHIPSILL